MNTTASTFAITGASGFVGSHLAAAIRQTGHNIVPIVRRPRRGARAIGLDDVAALSDALVGCDAVAHLAGINREIDQQTYDRVHVRGTANLIAAARNAGVRRIVMLSFLRARPDCGSAYHESKFAAEQLIRQSGLDYTIVKAGVIWGRGDHLLDHLSRALFTLPLFATVGFRQPSLRPVAVRDVARVLCAGLVEDRLRNKTVALTGPEELTMRQIVHRVAGSVDRRAIVFPMPVRFHRLFAAVLEATMRIPLIARAQVRILEEGLCIPAGQCDQLPADLIPTTRFTLETIRPELPPPGRFTCDDLRCCAVSA